MPYDSQAKKNTRCLQAMARALLAEITACASNGYSMPAWRREEITETLWPLTSELPRYLSELPADARRGIELARARMLAAAARSRAIKGYAAVPNKESL